MTISHSALPESERRLHARIAELERTIEGKDRCMRRQSEIIAIYARRWDAALAIVDTIERRLGDDDGIADELREALTDE